jgi:hypothetical protein
MRVPGCMILAGVTLLVAAPAMAQRYDPRYPVCLQRWLRGGITYIDCSYTNWDQCRATASGLSAMCLDNPYWSKLPQEAPRRRSRREGRVY